MGNNFFPIFINAKGKKVTVFGGGNIATRRVKTLAQFDFDISVVSTSITAELRELIEDGRVVYVQDQYDEKYIGGSAMILACTNDRETNKQIGDMANQADIPVSVCDRKEECTFYFPAVATNDEVVMGLVGNGNTHHITKKAAAKLREIIRGKVY